MQSAKVLENLIIPVLAVCVCVCVCVCIYLCNTTTGYTFSELHVAAHFLGPNIYVKKPYWSEIMGYTTSESISQPQTWLLILTFMNSNYCLLELLFSVFVADIFFFTHFRESSVSPSTLPVPFSIASITILTASIVDIFLLTSAFTYFSYFM